MYLENFTITSGYGNRPQLGDFHAGVDFGTPTGTPLPALHDGVVQFEGTIPAAKRGYSPEIICIVQSSGFFVVYGHLSQTLVNVGQEVRSGELIAKSGASGYVFGAHLHIEKRLGYKNSGTPLSVYQPIDITPDLLAYGQAQGGAYDMNLEEYASDILDVIEDNPHYAENKSESFRGHVGHLKANNYMEARRQWVKGIMANNGVMNATQMRQHLEADQAQTQAVDILEAQLTAAESRASAFEQSYKDADKELTEQTRSIEQMTKTINRQKAEMTEAAKTIKSLKEAAKNSDAVSALSPIELIRIAINRWLKGGA